MSSSPFNPPPEPLPPPTGTPDRRALLAAYQDVVREVKTRPKPRRIQVPDRAPFWITVSVVIAALLSLLVFQPAWLFNKPPAETPQEHEASLRIRMYVEIDRIIRYKDAHGGKLPETLAEAGADGSGLRYERHDGQFTLSGRNGELELTYRSGEPPEAFLGSSYEVVRARARKGR